MNKSEMKFAVFQTFAVSIIFINVLTVCYSAPSKHQERSLADNYTALTDDIKWFLRGVSKVSGTIEQMLPNVTTNLNKTEISEENTRLNLLMGLRHFLVGVREIAMTFEQNFKTDHIKQLQQLKNVTDYVSELISAIKIWFRQLRIFAAYLVQLYNRYIPEVLFGKCLGSYLVTTYPERSYYEYPFILLSEMYTSIFVNYSKTETTEFTTEVSILDTSLNMEQNEIPVSEVEDYKTSKESELIHQELDVTSTTKLDSDSESFFDLSSVLKENKDEIIESAVHQQSWQICFKLYTAESLSRSLKIYFLGLQNA